MAVIAGKAKWAKVHNPDVGFEPTWSIDVIVSSEDQEELQKEGLVVKEDKDGDIVLKVKCKCETKAGNPAEKPRVIYADGTECKDDIGNGSDVRVQFNIVDWTFKGRKGKQAYLKAVLVENLVPYQRDSELDQFIVKPKVTSDIPF